MNLRSLGISCLIAAAIALGTSLLYGPMLEPVAAPAPVPRYIFIFLADGGGIAHLETARLYNQHVHQEGLLITDKIMKEGSLGLLATHAADLLVTDSAAAATAMAAGCKTKTGMLGICEDGSVPKTVLELAKEKGMNIGVVTNSDIYDASPAAFLAHVRSRQLHSVIVDQYLKLAPDLLLGGGRDLFIPKSHPRSRRRDDLDMIASFKKQGYAYVSNRQELLATRKLKVLGLFSLREMGLEIDRNGSTEPSLREMTEAAIRLLEQNQRGFVLFVENEHIDSAAHLSDIASLIHEFRAFDRAIAVAYDFYQRHPRETLLLVTSDHETGGLGLTGAPTVESLRRIQSIRISFRRALETVGKEPSREAIERLAAEHFRGFALTPELKQALTQKKPLGPTFSNAAASALGAMVAGATQAYWLSSGHTNQPVFVAALGIGAERFRGHQDNTAFARQLFALLGKQN